MAEQVGPRSADVDEPVRWARPSVARRWPSSWPNPWVGVEPPPVARTAEPPGSRRRAVALLLVAILLAAAAAASVVPDTGLEPSAGEPVTSVRTSGGTAAVVTRCRGGGELTGRPGHPQVDRADAGRCA